MKAELHGVGQVRHDRRLMQEAAARRWYRLNPEGGAKLCARATGVPLMVADRVRHELKLPLPERGLMLGCPQ